MSHEMLIHVDENDNVIGYEPRDKCHLKGKELLHREVQIVVMNSKGEIALQKRSMKKDHFPGYLTNAASGHVEKGLTYVEAAKKELYEEAGVKDAILIKASKFRAGEDENHALIQIFTCTYDGQFLTNDEVDEINFYKLSEVKKILDKCTPNFKQTMDVLKIF